MVFLTEKQSKNNAGQKKVFTIKDEDISLYLKK